MRTEKSGEIVRGQPRPEVRLDQFVTNHAQDFARVLPKHMTPDRMVRLAISAVRTTAHLAECTVPSFASAIMACSVLGLEPNTPLGHAYLIPFKNNKRGGIYEVQLIVGYRGLVELMYRSGVVSSVKAVPVYKGDEFEYELGLHPDIRHKPSKDANRGANATDLTHVYPVVRLREAGLEPIWEVLNRAQLESRRKRSRASSSGPWVTDYVAMALKTGVRAIATWVPSSAEKTMPLSAAIAYEEANERGRPAQAIGALGDAAVDTLATMGAFPTQDEDDSEAANGQSELVDPETGVVTSAGANPDNDGR